MVCLSWECAAESAKEIKPPDNRRDEFHNADRLNDTWFQCIYSFNTLFKQFHLTVARKADIYRYLYFALPHHGNCLRFILSLINVPINKNKLCQEKSGRNQFWTDHSPIASTSSGSWWVSLNRTHINFEHFTFDNKVVPKNLPFSRLSASQHFNHQLAAITHFSETQ